MKNPSLGAPFVIGVSPPPLAPGGLTLVVPSHNEGASLARVLRDWWTQRPVGFDYQILVVDDASTDDTPRVLQQLASELPVRTVRNTTQLGYGASLQVGILHTTTEWLAMTDADGQFDPSDLPRLLSAVSQEHVLASGWRPHRADPFIRIVISFGFRWLLLLFFRARVRDPTATLKAGRTEPVRDIARQFRYMIGSFGNEFTIRWLRAGYRIVPVAVQHHPRLNGGSKIVAKGSIAKVAVKQFIALLRLWREFHQFSIPSTPTAHAEPDPD